MNTTSTAAMKFSVEAVILPVRDVDRALRFYVDQLGFTLDVDYSPNDAFRVVQLTPLAIPLCLPSSVWRDWARRWRKQEPGTKRPRVLAQRKQHGGWPFLLIVSFAPAQWWRRSAESTTLPLDRAPYYAARSGTARVHIASRRRGSGVAAPARFGNEKNRHIRAGLDFGSEARG